MAVGFGRILQDTAGLPWSAEQDSGSCWEVGDEGLHGHCCCRRPSFPRNRLPALDSGISVTPTEGAIARQFLLLPLQIHDC